MNALALSVSFRAVRLALFHLHPGVKGHVLTVKENIEKHLFSESLGDWNVRLSIFIMSFVYSSECVTRCRK